MKDLSKEENDILYKYNEKKGKLFKAGSFVICVTTIKDVADYLKEQLKELVTNMGIEVNIESNIREEQINLYKTRIDKATEDIDLLMSGRYIENNTSYVARPCCNLRLEIIKKDLQGKSDE